jgi:nucleoside-diphosphate-sugar epimerase
MELTMTASTSPVPISPGTPQIVLVLGISGAIGGAIAAALSRRGFRIRALVRGTPSASSVPFPVEWVSRDALNREQVLAAATGVTLIVHGVNPPGYTKWRAVGLPILANTIAAASAVGATILFPANVYVFSPASGAVVTETSPMAPTTRKGRVRLEMETMLKAAAGQGVRTISVRAGDFFGPGVTGSWFAQAVAKGGHDAKVLNVLADPGIGHSWAFIPDLAETFGRLVDCRDTLAPFEMVHFRGVWAEPDRAMAEAAHRAIGRADLRIKPFPWTMMYLGAPFVTFLREAIEMRWLWRHPLRLDNTKLERLIGPEPHTPLDTAIAAALDATPLCAAPTPTAAA